MLLAGLWAIAPGVPQPARGHAELVSSDPAANSTLTEAPKRLSLEFTEAVDPATVRVRLLDPRQAEIAGVGAPEVNGGGTAVSLALPELEPGTYTVDYQVTSAVDGHITSGIFAFLLDPTGTEPAPGVSSETDSPGSTPEATAARWVALASALAVAGILVFWAFSARPALLAANRRATAPWFAVAAAALLAFAALSVYLVLAARPLTEGGTGSWFPLDPAGPFGATQFAIAMRVALLGTLAAGLLALAGPVMSGRDERWMALVLAASVVGLGGMGFAGHAAASGGPLFAAFDLLHMLGVAAWLGALVGIVILAARQRDVVGQALRRHSRIALVAAPVVVLTGIANSPIVLSDEARDLVASEYGNLLLAKVVLFSAAVGMGAANFFLIRRRAIGATLAVVAVELAVAALAVVAAAGLVTGQPAAGRAPVLTSSGIGAAHLYGTAGASTVHVAVNLPAPGPQRYQVSVTDAATGGYRTDVQRVFLAFDPPRGSGLSSERVQLEPSAEPGLWGASGAYTPLVGGWQLEVTVRRAGERDETAAFPLEVVLPLPPQRVPPPDTGVGVPSPLALAWSVLPAGGVGWGLVLALLGSSVALAWTARRLRSGLMGAARLAVLLVAVLVGIGVGSRALVEAANAPPESATALPNPVESSAESVARGRSLYAANCLVCHGPGGRGDGPAAAGMLPPPASLPDRVPAMSDGAIAYRIAVGSAGTRMPAFAATLSENDRWDLVNFLRAEWPR